MALLALASCAPPAAAAERFESSSPSSTVGSAPAPTVVLITDPAGLPGGAARADLDMVLVPNPDEHTGGEPRIVVTWNQAVEHEWIDAQIVADIRLVLRPVADAEAPEPAPDSDSQPQAVEYLVDGAVRIDAAASTCSPKGARQSCAVRSVVDAVLVGTASVEGETLRVNVDWQRFGAEEAPGLPSVTFGRWNLGATRGSAPFAQENTFAVARALELSGLVGSTLVLRAANGAEHDLESRLGVGVGRGTLVVEGFDLG